MPDLTPQWIITIVFVPAIAWLAHTLVAFIKERDKQTAALIAECSIERREAQGRADAKDAVFLTTLDTWRVTIESDRIAATVRAERMIAAIQSVEGTAKATAELAAKLLAAAPPSPPTS